MATIEESITVNRPQADVFAYLDDLERHPEWQTDVVSNKVLTPGPTTNGTEVETTRKMGNRSVTMRWRVVDHDPPNSSGFDTYQGKMMKPRGVIAVEAAGQASRVTFSMDPRFEGVGKLLGPIFIERQIRSSVQKQLGQLKAILEK